MINPVVVVVTGRKGTTTPLVALELPFFSDQSDFGCTGGEAEFAALRDLARRPADSVVRKAGTLLYNGLRTNDDVITALGEALRIAQDQRRPFILELRKVDPSIEHLPWETLYAPDAGFLGLDRRWSVGRRVRSDQGQPTSVLSAPLRISAVMSCLGIPARGEWEQLADAVESSPIPVEVAAFVGEPALQRAINESRPSWLWGLEGIPESANDLSARFAAHRTAGFTPHILHFFCHGSLEFSPHLQIATKADWGRGDVRQSSLTLEPSEINQLSPPTDRPWLVVLNSCLGAAPGATAAAGSQPLALSLIKEGGYPAVIGMREPVDAADATTFSSCLYPELFTTLAAVPADREVTPDWSRLLITARRKLSEAPGVPLSQAAEQRPQWTLPVLYVRYRPGSADFSVTRADAAPVQPPPGVTAPVAPAGNDPLTTLLHDLLAVSGEDAPHNWPAELQARIDALRPGH